MYTSKQHFGQIQFIHLVTSFHLQAHYVNVKHTLTIVSPRTSKVKQPS